jgi:hypothetical protein
MTKEITETDWTFAYDHLNFVIADWVRTFGTLGTPWVQNVLLPLKKRYDLGERTPELYKRIMERE